MRRSCQHSGLIKRDTWDNLWWNQKDVHRPLAYVTKRMFRHCLHDSTTRTVTYKTCLPEAPHNPYDVELHLSLHRLSTKENQWQISIVLLITLKLGPSHGTIPSCTPTPYQRYTLHCTLLYLVIALRCSSQCNYIVWLYLPPFSTTEPKPLAPFLLYIGTVL